MLIYIYIDLEPETGSLKMLMCLKFSNGVDTDIDTDIGINIHYVVCR